MRRVVKDKGARGQSNLNHVNSHHVNRDKENNATRLLLTSWDIASHALTLFRLYINETFFMCIKLQTCKHRIVLSFILLTQKLLNNCLEVICRASKYQ